MMYDTHIDLIRAITKFAVIFIMICGGIGCLIHILSECIPYGGPVLLLIGLSAILKR